MKKKRVIILGAGIGGLATAHALLEKGNYSVTVLEKRAEAGGYIETSIESGFLFEKGPRTFRAESLALLKLIDELGLSDQVIHSDTEAKRRYLWTEGQLIQVPSWALIKKMVWPFLKEWNVPPYAGEETIYQFAARRFNSSIAEQIFDPLALGVFAGDIHTLSMTACFPKLKAWEIEYGSLSRGFFSQRRQKKGGLFSLRSGTKTLVEALQKELGSSLHLEQEAVALKFTSEGVEVKTHNQIWKGDHVISALPARVIGKLFLPIDKEIAADLLHIEHKTLSIVHVGFHEDLLPLNGFGYLVPSKEKEKVLGAIFDSKIFPQQNRALKETRLTFMLRENGSEEDVLRALRCHLNIHAQLAHFSLTHLSEAIPQYAVGHIDRIANLERKITARFPQCHLVGNYLRGPSVNDTIRSTQEDEWMLR